MTPRPPDQAEVAIIATGVANTASVCAAFERLGRAPRLTADPRDIARAPVLVLPGVGAFGPGMDALTRAGLVEPLIERLRAGRPLLAICLGLQLLAAASQESPGVAGLAVLPGAVTRLGGPRSPQMGWNAVEPPPGASLIRPGFAYFANTFALPLAPQPGRQGPPGWLAATAHYGGPFIAALERGPQLACQFHPELSGAWGAALLGRWLAVAEAPAC